MLPSNSACRIMHLSQSVLERYKEIPTPSRSCELVEAVLGVHLRLYGRKVCTSGVSRGWFIIWVVGTDFVQKIADGQVKSDILFLTRWPSCPVSSSPLPTTDDSCV